MERDSIKNTFFVATTLCVVCSLLVATAAVALREGFSLARCAFVGDSANDVWVAREAGFTVALNPKAKELEDVADAVVRSPDLRAILPHLLPASNPEPSS